MIQWCQRVRRAMDCFQTVSHLKGSLCQQLLLFILWLSSFQDVASLQTLSNPSHISSASELANPPSTELFEPIEISPAVIPRYPYPGESLPPMYPTFPTTYEPNLTGRCPVNFSAMSNVMGKTASDCSQPLAALVGNVICCPQLDSLLHLFQGFYNINSDKLVLRNAVANDCFSDIISILASRGANSTIPILCSVKSSNLTGGSCPVKDVNNFEKTINASKLLEACSIVDPLKECCRPVCQPAIMEAALQISGTQMMLNENKNVVGETIHIDAINDCKRVVYSYLSRKLPPDVANTAFRILSACKVNKGCLLRSLPADVIFDNSTGYSFTCDLTDNIAAPWPLSSSMSSLSFCAPEMSLPALPTSETMKNPGCHGCTLEILVPIFSFFVFSTFLY
ncbi:uncharacterized GPI-anchored protein At1g61900-like isoform X3 [Durio zibethinus]|uniref:Uncharacterized GPI-anchored protein At1g61900-like isoform X3 n=1 Tax=Durio zibethinus TaxID=66656 RepID=A0A6P5X2U5_DURZI|nr:uncharacterized GPI-anchored protein At1g61900-like isoform X3 [Durio zibethinus]